MYIVFQQQRRRVVNSRGAGHTGVLPHRPCLVGGGIDEANDHSLFTGVANGRAVA